MITEKGPRIDWRHCVYLAQIAVAIVSTLAAPSFAIDSRNESLKINGLNQEFILITANRVLSPVPQWGARLTEIDTSTQLRRGEISIVNSLNLLPQVGAVDTGHQQSLFMRGLPSQYTKMMVNGIDMKDPISPQGAPFWDGLILSTIDSLSLIDGSQGAILGQSAIAGAINASIAPRGFQAQLIGAGDYWQRSLKAGIDVGDWALVAVMSGERDHRLSSLKDGSYPDIDPYHSDNQFVSAEWHPSNFKWIGQVLRTDSIAYLDNPYGDHPDGILSTQILRGGSRAEWKLSPTITPAIESTYSRIARNDTSGPSTYTGEHLSLGATVTSQLGSIETVTGLTFRSETGSSTYQSSNRIDSTDIFSSIAIDASPLQVSMSGRGIFNSQNQSGVVGSVGTAVSLWQGAQWTSSIGTGFRCPSLYELLNSENLVAERSWSGDTRISMPILMDAAFYASAFYSEIQNRTQDTYQAPTYNLVYINQPGITIAKGVELGISSGHYFRLSYNRTISGSDNGEEARIPEFKWTATAIIPTPLDHTELQIDFSSVGSRRDSMYSTQRLSEYSLTHMSLTTQWSRHWSSFIRLSNVWDTQYELASGYTTMGRSILVGITFRVDSI